MRNVQTAAAAAPSEYVIFVRTRLLGKVSAVFGRIASPYSAR